MLQKMRLRSLEKTDYCKLIAPRLVTILSSPLSEGW
jgi:hypothetical protein